jgi:hypothetical protein
VLLLLLLSTSGVVVVLVVLVVLPSSLSFASMLVWLKWICELGRRNPEAVWLTGDGGSIPSVLAEREFRGATLRRISSVDERFERLKSSVDISSDTIDLHATDDPSSVSLLGRILLLSVVKARIRADDGCGDNVDAL